MITVLPAVANMVFWSVTLSTGCAWPSQCMAEHITLECVSVRTQAVIDQLCAICSSWSSLLHTVHLTCKCCNNSLVYQVLNDIQPD